MKYHPDRNSNDDLSAAVFTEIAEAYAVLSDLSARKSYNDQRYITAFTEYSKPAETIETMLNKATVLKNKIATADPFRFNRDALLYFIKQLLPADVSMLINADVKKQQQFLEIIVWYGKFLSSIQLKNYMELLKPLFEKHKWMQQQLEEQVINQTKKENWDKYKVVLAFIITAILCALIFFITRH